MDGWMDRWMDGWIDRCMYVSMYVCMYVRTYACMNTAKKQLNSNYHGGHTIIVITISGWLLAKRKKLWFL